MLKLVRNICITITLIMFVLVILTVVAIFLTWLAHAIFTFFLIMIFITMFFVLGHYLWEKVK